MRVCYHEILAVRLTADHKDDNRAIQSIRDETRARQARTDHGLRAFDDGDAQAGA